MTNHQPAAKLEHPSVRTNPKWPHPRERTGVRFVLTNVTDPSRADDYSAWYDDYENAIIRPGTIANALRFENPDAAGTETDPRYATIYDLVTPDPASAWPATENSPDYPTRLFTDPRSKLVAPALRGSYAMTGSIEAYRLLRSDATAVEMCSMTCERRSVSTMKRIHNRSPS